ncbi:AfsR/SARP family transcriptional regulator [Streptomyces xiamenensis]
MRFFILGATEARHEDGRVIPLGGPRVRALLTALALRADGPGPVPVDTLIAGIWPDGDAPADAPAALQALVGRLRRALGEEGRRLIGHHRAPVGYRLTAGPESVDLFRFERLVREADPAHADPATVARTLRTALALWRGPALADLPESARHPVAVRARTLRLTALRRRITADLALGPAEPLLPELRELTAEHPLDEPVRALHLRALRAAGRPAQALAAYEAVRTTLAERLGTTPGPELRALYAELLAEDSEDSEDSDDARDAGDARPTGNRAAGSPAPRRPPGTAPAGNIRPRLTSFVGREADLSALEADLRTARLVTLTGAGGSGKTRLAEQAALATGGQDRYPDGAWIAELAKLDHPTAVPGAVLSALGLRETSVEHHHDPAARLLEYCAGRELLLVLDNCEHVITAAATLAETLLTHCPRLTVLATSREPLGVPGERVRPVEPLPPAPAHRLFTERGAAVRRDLPADEPAVAEICRRLDGLPLAIELAAARLRTLTPRQIAARLDDRFRLLTSGWRTVLPRQQTLRAVVDWSWDLLEEPERTVLRRLSVFAGGWTLAAAEAVCADGRTVTSGQVLDLLGSLVDKSIVLADTGAGTPDRADEADEADGDTGAGTDDGTGARYRMLETIHEYAAERAAEHPAERAATRARHTAHVLRFVQRAEPRLRGPGQLHWFARVEADLDNIRAALRRALRAADRDSAGQLVVGMGWFWYLRNYRAEGLEWIRHTIALDPDADQDAAPAPADGEPWPDDPRYLDRLELRLLAAFLMQDQDHSSFDLTDETLHRQARRMFTAFGVTDRERGTRFPGMLWPFTGFMIGETFHDIARRMTESIGRLRARRASAAARATGPGSGDWELAVMLLFRFRVSLDVPGAYSTVRHRAAHDVEDLAELEDLAHRVGDRWLTCQTHGLRGEYFVLLGDYPGAADAFTRAVRTAEEVGAHAEVPFFTARLAEATYYAGDIDGAGALLTATVARAEELGLPDCLGLTQYLGATMALENGDPGTARTLRERAARNLKAGTPAPMFQVIMGILTSRLLLAEGAPWRDALSELRTALSYGVLVGCSDLLLSQLLLGAAATVSAGGRTAVAARLLATAYALRGDLPLTPPERRAMDALPLPPPGGEPPLERTEALDLVTRLLSDS